MSWNLKRLRLTDPLETARIDRLSSFLQALASPPDVLGVQELIVDADDPEAGQTAFDSFAIRLGYEPRCSVLGQAGTARTRTAIFSRFPEVDDRGAHRAGSVTEMQVDRSLWPDARVVDVPNPIRFSRPPVHITLQLPSRSPVTVVAAHLKSRRPLFDPTSETAREEDRPSSAVALAAGLFASLQMRAIESLGLRMLLSRLADGRCDQPLIVLCDLNDGLEAVTTEIVLGTSTPMEQSCGARDVLFDVTMLIEPGERWSYQRRGARLHLDHILVSQAVGSPVDVGICHDVIGRSHSDCLSDHAPVWAALDVA